MSCFENIRYELYSFLDRVFGLSGYFEGVIDSREFAVESLQCYVSHLIEYFEDIPFMEEGKNREKLTTLEHFLGQAKSVLDEIHGFEQRTLKELERYLLFVMMRGSDLYAERSKHLGNSKSIFDAKSAEIKRLLYKMHGGESFMFTDFFIKTKIVKKRLIWELDRDTIEIRKLHEYEFSDEIRSKYKASKSGEV